LVGGARHARIVPMSPSLDPSRLLHSSEQSTDAYLASVEELRRDTLRRVRDDMLGQPADRVKAVLIARLQGRLPGIEVDDEQMQRVAWAIEHGRAVG
jgi:hypothetical protein